MSVLVQFLVIVAKLLVVLTAAVTPTLILLGVSFARTWLEGYRRMRNHYSVLLHEAEAHRRLDAVHAEAAEQLRQVVEEHLRQGGRRQL